MTKQTSKKTIINAINKLNKKIDVKIVNGLNYEVEAIKHFELIKYLKYNF